MSKQNIFCKKWPLTSHTHFYEMSNVLEVTKGYCTESGSKLWFIINVSNIIIQTKDNILTNISITNQTYNCYT